MRPTVSIPASHCERLDTCLPFVVSHFDYPPEGGQSAAPNQLSEWHACLPRYLTMNQTRRPGLGAFIASDLRGAYQICTSPWAAVWRRYSKQERQRRTQESCASARRRRCTSIGDQAREGTNFSEGILQPQPCEYRGRV